MLRKITTTARNRAKIGSLNIRFASKALTLALLGIFATSALAGWERQWMDSFDGTGVDWDNWTAQTQANYNNEVQCYTDDDSSADKNYDVSNGTLKIIARKQTVSCTGLGGQMRTWTSGRLNSKDKSEFLYGRIESKIRFSTLAGGTWPAFWMLENRIREQPIAGDGDNANWPNPGAGEIDVWEWFSNQPDSYITNFFNTNGCGGEFRPAYPNGATDVLDWHTYAIEWTPETIRFYRDGTMVRSQNIATCPQYKEPMFVLLNVAIGGNLGGAIDPNLTIASMEVDYVAHCTPTDGNGDTLCNEQTPSFADDDGDGVGNNEDLCPNSAAGETVDADGCSIVTSTNDAPEVRLVVMQGGQAGASIDPADGMVTITATISDPNSADTHTLTWDLAAVPGAVENGHTVTIDPAGLTDGNYTISANVSDDGDPVLSDSSTVGFVVTTPAGEPDPDPVVTPPAGQPDPDPAVNSSPSSGSSGGAIGLALLLILGGFAGLDRMMRRRACHS